MRASIRQQAELVAQGINPNHVEALTGSEADLATPSYKKLKEQLVAARSVHSQYRSVYLMGHSADGQMILLVDSEPADSTDYASPGAVFKEASGGFRQAFEAKHPVVEGPVTHRWGTWISALIPMVNARSGKVTVLGLDVDARSWALEVAARAALPLGLMLGLVIVTSAVLATTRRHSAASRPVLIRLLPPLLALLLLLIAISAILLWRAHQTSLHRQLTAANTTIAAELHLDLKNQTHTLATVIRTLAADPRLQEALAHRNFDRLRSDWEPLFNSLQKEQKLTHFYFFDPKRICHLRLHKPEKHGDLINRFTLLEAERIGSTASGLEIGPLGLVTLRVVRPVFREGQFVGFIELGKEIEDVLHDRYRQSGSHLAVTLRKELVDRPQWEESMQSLGREADWNRLERRVINYTTLGPRLPDAFAQLLAHGESEASEAKVSLAGKTWHTTALPLADASGQEIGDLLVLTDITAPSKAFEQQLILGATTVGVLLAGIIAFLIVLLHRTDADITAQLTQSRERSRRTSRQREAIAQLALDPDIASGDLTAAIKRIIIITAATVDVARVGVWKLSEDGHELHCLGLYEAASDTLSQSPSLTLEEAPCYFEAIRQETTIVVEDALNDARTSDLVDSYLGPLGIGALLDAGILLGGSLKGIVCLEHFGSQRAWQSDEEGFARTVAALVAQLLLNAERFQTEKALHASEAQFRALFADSPVSIIIHDRDNGEIIDANPSACAMYGFTTVAELQANSFWLEPPYSFTEALAWIRKASTEGTQQFEWLNRRMNGELFWEHVHLSPLTIGGEQRILATTIDITALKRSEETLRKLSQAVEQSPASVVITDLKGAIEYVNPKFCAITGYTREEAIGSNPRILKSEGTDSSTYIELWNTITAGGEWKGEFRNRKKNGEEYWELATISPIRNSQGQITHYLAVKEDITGRKQTEHLLHRQDTLLQAVADGVHTLLSQDHIDEAVQQTLQIVGQATDQDRAYLFEHHVDPVTGENLMSQRYEWVRNGVSLQIDNPELQNLSFDRLFPRWLDLMRRGEAVAGRVADFPSSERSILEPQEIISLMVVPVTVGGRLWGFIGFDNCRTDYQWGAEEQAILISLAASLGAAIMRRRAEMALRESNLKLEEATRTKSLFLANMSHEIRTPMNAIIGMTYLVSSTELDRRQRDYVQQIQHAAQSLLRIINDILDFSKIEAGKLELETVVFRLEDIAANALSLQRHPALDKQIELLFDPRSSALIGDSGTFLGDPLRLEQILTNLLTNGVKFTRAGHVLLALEEVGRTGTSCELRLIVEDTGIGMTAEQIDQLFTEFSQADSSTTRLHGGTGLGLSIAKRILTLMGGDIAVTSEPGRGSRFTCTLTLPSVPAADQGNEPAAQIGRALIVDDHAPARAVLRSLLSHFGLDCTEAEGGAAALDLLQKPGAGYDYLFIDWVMPDMGGEALIKALHALPLAPRPVIVVVSADDLERIHACCGRQGLCHFLPKPVLPRDVRALLATGQEAMTAETTSERDGDRPCLQGIRLLLVEDNLINQQITTEMLSYHGATVDVAGNGQEALDLLASINDNPYQVVLMDIQMPVLDGYETTRRLRGEPKFARLPIIAMTAHAMIEEKERCLAAGMNAHVAKPFSMDDLLEALGPYIKRTAAVPAPPPGVVSTDHMVAGGTEWYPGLDLNRGLVHCGGSRDLFDRIAAGYRREFTNLVELLEECLAQEQWEELAVLVHGFKGLSGTIGAADLQELAGEIEQACANRSLKMPVLLDRLRHLLATTLTSLRRMQPSSPGGTAPPPIAEAFHSPQEILAELCHLLAESDSAAQDLWRHQEQTLRTVLPPTLARQITQAIDRFQFQEALNLLTAYQGQ
jgi:PAS domain S-box-containing protein